MERNKGICFIVAALIGGSAIFVGDMRAGASEPAPTEYVTEASFLSGVDFSAIDPTVTACQNFYEHACGGFIKSVTLTSDQSMVSLSQRKFDANLTAGLDKLFSLPATPGGELDRLRTFYTSCLHDSEFSSVVVRTWLARIDAVTTHKQMQMMIRDLSEIGVDPFFSYSGVPDLANLHAHRGEINHSNIWQEPALVEQAFLAAGLTAEQAVTDAESVRVIVTKLRESRTRGNDPSAYQNPTVLAQLAHDAPAINWRAYFAMVGAKPHRPINVTSEKYLTSVSHEIAARTPAEIRAYLRWAFLFSLRGELPPPFNSAFGDITPSLRVALENPNKRCQEATLRGMGVEFSRQYSQKVLGLNARQVATQIGRSIQRQIADAVEQADWLSPASRRTTADKLRKTDLKIGFPDQWPPVGSFPVKPNSFVENVLAARRYEAQRAWSRANKPRLRNDWEMLVYPWVGKGMAAARLTTPNGFPDLNTNSMIITAAFLNPPLFYGSAPIESNYGVFGTVFAHEFVHLAESHQYDAMGRQRETWSATDTASAQRKHQCVIDQANASPAPAGSKVSGERNLSENVADLGGVSLAYNALSNRLGAQINKADGSGLTPARRFFYQYAQSHCTAATPDTLKNLVADDSHGLPTYRVNNPLSNLPAFGKAFGCQAGTPMRRTAEKICRVW